MRWIKEDAYVRLKLASYGLGRIFGISIVRWYPSEKLEPYVAYIMEYIEKKMILSGVDDDIKQKLDIFDELYHEIMDHIINDEIIDLLTAMGISSINTEESETEIEYSEILFVTATVNFVTALYMQLRYNYSHLYLTPQTDCHSCSGNGSSMESAVTFNYCDPRPMQDGYEFGRGTQELWGPGLTNI